MLINLVEYLGSFCYEEYSSGNIYTFLYTYFGTTVLIITLHGITTSRISEPCLTFKHMLSNCPQGKLTGKVSVLYTLKYCLHREAFHDDIIIIECVSPSPQCSWYYYHCLLPFFFFFTILHVISFFLCLNSLFPIDYLPQKWQEFCFFCLFTLVCPALRTVSGRYWVLNKYMLTEIMICF